MNALTTLATKEHKEKSDIKKINLNALFLSAEALAKADVILCGYNILKPL